MPDNNNCFRHLSANFTARYGFLLNFSEKYCILCLLSLCEKFVCSKFEFGAFLFVMLLNWRPHLNVRKIIDVKHLGGRESLEIAVNRSYKVLHF